MADITKVGNRFVVGSPVKDFEKLASAALAQITNDQTILANGPTNAQVVGVIENILNRQEKEILALRKLLRLAERLKS